MPNGTLVLIAGPNGAGKTTLVSSPEFRELLPAGTKLNADDRTLEKLHVAGFRGFSDVPPEQLKKLFIEAANEVQAEAESILAGGGTVSLETVLSTDKYRRMVEDIQKRGGRFLLIYVALRSPDISRHRVSVRVAKAGHDVPEDRLRERWQKSLKHLGWFAAKADRFFVFDNSGISMSVAPVQIACGGAGRIKWLVKQEEVFEELRNTLNEAFAR